MSSREKSRRILLAHGYPRQQIELNLKKNVPTSIIKLIKEFYALYEWIDFECYDESYIEQLINKETSSMILKVRDDATSEEDNRKTVCSNIALKEGVHIWKLKCIQYGGLFVDAIGIVQTPQPKQWYNAFRNSEGKPEETMGQTYFAFNRHFFDINKANKEVGTLLTARFPLRDIGKRSKSDRDCWSANDELVMTLDFDKATFAVTRQRENEEDLVWSIGIIVRY